MTLDEVQQRVREVQEMAFMSELHPARAYLYHDVLRALLTHDLPEDARQLIEAALEAER